MLDDVQSSVGSSGTPAELSAALKRLGSLCKRNTYGIFDIGESVAKKCKAVLTGAAWTAAIERRDLRIVQALEQFVR